MRDLKQNTISGMKWSVFERFSVQGIQFLLGVFVARILSSTDYGLVGMLSIFMAISQSFIDCGFSSALIQKKNRTETDFSTVFYFNVVISVLLYLILFFLAPSIARFYDEPKLNSLTCLLGLNLVISALSVVQRTKLTILLNFKTLSKASLISTIVSGVVGLILAYEGLGVWALVWQSLISNVLTTILIWYFANWHPMWIFSLKSFKELFGFGFRLLCSGLLNTIYDNLYQLVIGKRYCADALGYYVRAQQFAFFPSSNISGIVQRVTYPVLCEIQDDNERLRRFFCRFLRMTAFIVFPLMFGLIVLSRPMILVVLTAKWEDAVPLLQLLCIGFMLYPIHALNLNILQAKGRSDLYLKLEIVKKIVGIIILVITIPWGIKMMSLGLSVYSVVSFMINTYYTKKIITFGFLKQVQELLPLLLMSVLMSLIVLLVTSGIDNNIWKLVVGFFTGCLSYLMMAYFLRMNELTEIFNILRKMWIKWKKTK